MQLLDFLPSCHYARTAADTDVAPHCVEVVVVYGADVGGVVCEGCEIVACELVVVVFHCVGEAADYCFGDVCERSVVASAKMS